VIGGVAPAKEQNAEQALKNGAVDAGVTPDLLRDTAISLAKQKIHLVPNAGARDLTDWKSFTRREGLSSRPSSRRIDQE
jgi:hypothetical protein